MQSTERTTEERSNFDALIDELHQFARAENAQGMALTANRYVRAALALAAERGRADRAEARIERAPHGSRCSLMRGVPIPVNCNCWKSEATA